MVNNYAGYNMSGFNNPYIPQSNMSRINIPQQSLRILQVSNIAEANATPVDSLSPTFFYNKAENVIYMKQIDQTGAAPIRTFKLQAIEEPLQSNLYENDFKAINDSLDSLSSKLDKLLSIDDVMEEKSKGKK